MRNEFRIESAGPYLAVRAAGPACRRLALSALALLAASALVSCEEASQRSEWTLSPADCRAAAVLDDGTVRKLDGYTCQGRQSTVTGGGKASLKAYFELEAPSEGGGTTGLRFLVGTEAKLRALSRSSRPDSRALDGWQQAAKLSGDRYQSTVFSAAESAGPEVETFQIDGEYRVIQAIFDEPTELCVVTGTAGEPCTTLEVQSLLVRRN